MKSKNILMLAIGIAIIPAAAIFANQSGKIDAQSIVVEQSEQPTAQADPIESDKLEVQNVMKQYVQGLTADNDLMPIIYKGKVLQLKLATSEKYPDGFHAGVSNQGNLYTSCADFVDSKTGDKYDIDFLVSKSDGKLQLVQPFVHSVNGVKNPYDLEH
ncbi:hypothetical protein C1752_07293 [Acaryochloris thomasi RCC1774]|uniref:Uncharacterized protein n=1 Tax=Acaryochloris thomasi RCC1774 TaxID=1764569 RepID=A0A2W1JB29_9CYAN|nr:hypothetical protein [Acaryochloris thomasi]PZD71293.1 hypothetical protein C1752_07293 [Acaryochloris thomasi RCC1774]